MVRLTIACDDARHIDLKHGKLREKPHWRW
jgi:hypothetical protein